MCVYTDSNWSHRNSIKSCIKTFGSHARKTLTIFSTTDSCTWNNTHNTESPAVCNFKLGLWESPLVQEKYQWEKFYETGDDDKNNNNNKIIITITGQTVRQRKSMKLTDEINVFIVRSYYRITETEIDLTAYRNKLYREFMEKNMATANGLYRTAGTVHSGYYSKQITRQLETDRCSACCLHKAVVLNTCCTVRNVLAEQWISSVGQWHRPVGIASWTAVK